MCDIKSTFWLALVLLEVTMKYFPSLDTKVFHSLYLQRPTIFFSLIVLLFPEAYEHSESKAVASRHY